MKDCLYPLRVIHGRMHEWRLKKKTEYKYMRDLLFPFGKKIYLIGTPTHINIGDSAIVLAEILFLQKEGVRSERIKELTVEEINENKDLILRCLRKAKKKAFCFHGGGNMGDQWFKEEAFRRRFLHAFPDDPIIIFPQTIFYTDTEEGRLEESNSIDYYNGHQKLTIVAREKKSFDIMRRLYPDTDILLTPDIVLSCSADDYGVVEQNRCGVLFCTRTDKEKSVDETVWEVLQKKASAVGKGIRKTDMYSENQVTKENRAERVREKMQEFCEAELVITDRLHGMVFAAIASTPCIVFSNNNHKVKGTFEWIEYLPYIRYVETLEEAERAMYELLQLSIVTFDNEPLKSNYKKLSKAIQEICL